MMNRTFEECGSLELSFIFIFILFFLGDTYLPQFGIVQTTINVLCEITRALVLE